MATYTSHYHLKKPEPTDTTEIITDLNDNYDTIDTALDSINTGFSAHIIDTAPHQTQQLLYLTDPVNEITYRFGISGNHMYYEEVV